MWTIMDGPPRSSSLSMSNGVPAMAPLQPQTFLLNGSIHPVSISDAQAHTHIHSKFYLPRGRTSTLLLISWRVSTSLLRATAWLEKGDTINQATRKISWRLLLLLAKFTSRPSGSIGSAEPFACGCSLETARQFLWAQKKTRESRWEKSSVRSQFCMCVHACACVCVSHIAARSTMVDISCRASSVRVEMASRNHSLMSVTTWSVTSTPQAFTVCRGFAQSGKQFWWGAGNAEWQAGQTWSFLLLPVCSFPAGAPISS